MKKFDIQLAIGIHGIWKKRLADAIETGKSEFKAEAVRQDALCEFGKWLHGLPAQEREHQLWAKVHALHESFHRLAADVLEDALAGRKEKAAAAVAAGSEYHLTSMRLTAALMEWMQSC